MRMQLRPTGVGENWQASSPHWEYSMTDITKLMRPHLVKVATYHGVDPSEELARSAGIKPEEVIRLNANENPYGAPEEVLAAISNIKIHLYPDPEQRKLRAKLAEYTGQPVSRVMAGAGGDEIIDLLLRLFTEPGQKLIDCEPTFGMYSFCARIADAPVVMIPRKDDWSIDLERVLAVIDDQTRLIFLASPNNPTGNLLTEAEARALLNTGLILAVDETYYEFCGKSLSYLLDEYENLVILRSFSKWAGIAGLRVGYCIGSETLIRHLMDIKQPYNINIAAETAAIAALDNRASVLERANTLVEQRKRLERTLDDLDGVSYYPSEGNFLLCKFEGRSAKDVYQGLGRRGIFVRLFSTDRLTDSLRISAGTPEQTDRLIAAIRDVVAEGK
jgi:histidinol-phosphate aminotransferase